MTENERVQAIFRIRFPRASASFIALNSQIQPTELEQDAPVALVKAAAGKEKGLDRVVLRFRGCFVRPRDPDNFAGSLKNLIDGLRHSGVIEGDEPWRIKLELEQEKVNTYAEERTVIEIEYP
jgi:hypothetical protein